MKRLFIASGFAPEFSASVGELVKRGSAGLTGVKWVSPGALHVTYSFLGDMPPGKIKALSAAMDAMPKLPAFEANACGLGVFPQSGPPTVIWLGFTGGTEGFKACSAAVAGAVAQADVFIPWREAFIPHLTLGRVKKRLDQGAFYKFREACGQFSAVSPVNEIALYESKLGPSGPEYSKLHSVALK